VILQTDKNVVLNSVHSFGWFFWLCFYRSRRWKIKDFSFLIMDDWLSKIIQIFLLKFKKKSHKCKCKLKTIKWSVKWKDLLMWWIKINYQINYHYYHYYLWSLVWTHIQKFASITICEFLSIGLQLYS
jgi:hypothetical protein